MSYGGPMGVLQRLQGPQPGRCDATKTGPRDRLAEHFAPLPLIYLNRRRYPYPNRIFAMALKLQTNLHTAKCC